MKAIAGCVHEALECPPPSDSRRALTRALRSVMSAMEPACGRGTRWIAHYLPEVAEPSVAALAAPQRYLHLEGPAPGYEPAQLRPYSAWSSGCTVLRCLKARSLGSTPAAVVRGRAPTNTSPLLDVFLPHGSV